MRRLLLSLPVLLVLTSSFVQAQTPPPPPPPSDEGGSTFRHQGALLDRSPQHRDQQLSVFLGLPSSIWYYGFGLGVGARYYIPILHDGFIPAVNDEFGIEFGADFTGAFGYGYFLPIVDIPVEVMWNFHFTQNFSAYAKVGIAFELQFYGSNYYLGRNNLYFTVNPVTAVGLFYKFSNTLSLRAEVGYPWIKVGLAFAL
jgi:hypothetical protein